MNRFIIVIALASVINARLFTFRDFENYMPRQQANDIKVVTTCTKVDTTKLSDKLLATQTVYAGYLNAIQLSSSVIKYDDNHFYQSLAFIFYGSQKATSEADISKYPTIIWLNGGPGSSSQLGNFMELGPITFGNDGSQSANKFSWTTEYNVMFIDQPIGAGYSFAAKPDEIPINEDQVASQFLYALNEFFVSKDGCIVNNKLTGLKSSSWFLFGESYAGKYIPAISQLWIKTDSFPVKLEGIGIGDGFTDPAGVIAEMSGLGYNLGLIDYQERQKSESLALTGVMRIQNQKWALAKDSFNAVGDYIVKQSGNMNIYNIFVEGTYKTQEDAVVAFLNSDNTKTILGFQTGIAFDMSSKPVNDALVNDFMQRDCIARLEAVLTAKLPVLIYSGQNDLIVPTPATLRLINSLNWPSAAAFNAKDFDIWKVNNKYSGYKKSQDNLEYRTVNRAGHLVPMDQGEAALDMVVSFVGGHK